MVVAVILTWLCALAIGRAPRPFHRFLSRYVRYATHVYAFLFMVGNPFPGFVGKPGSYPVDLELAAARAPEAAGHLLPRLAGLPALLSRSGLGGALFDGRVPRLVRRALPRPDAGRASATSAPTRSATAAR